MAFTQFSPREVRTSSTVLCISEKLVAAVTVLVPASDCVPTRPSALVLKWAMNSVLTVSLKEVNRPVMVGTSESSAQAPSR